VPPVWHGLETKRFLLPS